VADQGDVPLPLGARPRPARSAAAAPRWRKIDEPGRLGEGQEFAERQIGRLGVVGSNATTAPVIEDSYVRLLGLLDARLRAARFLFGARPAASDFGLYGQLTQLAAFDPTPRAIALERAPRVVAWIDLVEDLSGLEPGDSDWIARDAAASALRPLLIEVGRVYAPFLLANADALARRADASRPTTGPAQKPFPYQAAPRVAARGMPAVPGDRHGGRRGARGDGCEALFE
jgi:hypothetical protein